MSIQEQSKLLVERVKKINISSGEDVIVDDEALQNHAWDTHEAEQEAVNARLELA